MKSDVVKIETLYNVPVTKDGHMRVCHGCGETRRGKEREPGYERWYAKHLKECWNTIITIPKPLPDPEPEPEPKLMTVYTQAEFTTACRNLNVGQEVLELHSFQSQRGRTCIKYRIKQRERKTVVK